MAMSSTWLKFYGAFLAIFMLIFGTLNTIFSKYQNLRSFQCANETYECIVCPDSPEELEDECINFEQPVYQTFTMFLGEFICFFVFYISLFWKTRQAKKTGEIIPQSKLTGLRKLIFVIPTLCDMTATTLMNLGLIYTYASVFQMLRGAVVIFTGIMSVIFLKRKQYPFHWLGMVLVVAGVSVVGSASIIFADEDSDAASDPALGAILIICAQVFTAFQFVFEEKYLSKYEVPALQAVGYEGLYGVLFLVILMPIFQVTAGNKDFGGLFDLRFAFEAFLNFPSITVSSFGSIMSIAFFNFFGLTITKVLSATARSTIDACRTLSVWVFGILVGWEVVNKYTSIQVVGFLVLILGTFTYNQVFKYPCFKYEEPVNPDEVKPLNAPGEDEEDEDPRHYKSVTYSTIE